MDFLNEIIAEVAAETLDDYDDVFYDAESPPEDEFTLWDDELSRRLGALQSKKDDILDKVVDLIADVPQLRREVVKLREEVKLLKASLLVSPSSKTPSSEQSPSSSSSSQTTPNTPTAPTKKKRRRKRKRKSSAPPTSPLPTPILHSTPAPSRHPPPSNPPLSNPPPSNPPSQPFLSQFPPPSAEHPYTPVTRPSQQPSTHRNIIRNIHFYHDSNNKYTTPRDIQTAIDNIHEMTNKPRQAYNIILHKTFTLQQTLNDIKKRNLTNSIVIIDTTTNNAKYDNEDQTSPQRTHEMLCNILHTLQHQHKLINKDIIMLETIPSLKFDIHPYNLAAAATCKQTGVRFCSNLVGESHLFEKDGIHVLHRHRPLLVSSVAAAVVGVDPHQLYRLQRPPLGPNGPWRFRWGSQNRPVPTSRWPPRGLLPTANRYSILTDHNDT